MAVRDVSTSSATLQWRPVLSGLRGHYEIRFGPVPTGGVGSGTGTGTSPSTGGSQYQKLTQPADTSAARLTGLKPDTTYTATLTPKYDEQAFNTLSVTFTTKPGGSLPIYSQHENTSVRYTLSTVLVIDIVISPVSFYRGAEPSCGNGLRVRANQCSSELGSTSARNSHKLLH